MRRRTVLGNGLAVAAAVLMPRAAGAADAAGLVLHCLGVRRREIGLPPVLFHSALAEMARRHILHMHRLGRVTHGGPDGGEPPARALQAGYPGHILGEALAEGATSAAETVDLWLACPATRDVLLDPLACEAGAAWYEVDSKRRLWDLAVGCGTREMSPSPNARHCAEKGTGDSWSRPILPCRAGKHYIS